MAQHNPYVGPRPFTEEEERFFFGRSEEIEILTSLVVARRASLLFAQSGAGKTSLLLAGLTPRLLRHQRLVRNRPVVQPLVSAIRLARVGKGIEEQRPDNIFVQSAGISLAADGSAAIPRDATLLNLLPTWIPTAPAALPDSDDAALPFLLVFDQFEELFTRHLAFRHQREGFFKQVGEALSAHDELRVMFSMREDYLAELTPFAHLLPDQLRPRFRLERLGFDAALEAIKRPAERAVTPHPFAEGVAEELCRNLQSGTTDDIEAILLQVACKRLWQNLPDDRAEIGREDVKAAGNVDSALEAYYNDVVTTVVQELGGQGEPVGERRVRRFFSQQLLTPSRTRALVYRDEKTGLTGGLPNAAIDILSRSDVNILRRETRGAANWYELSHDRLIPPVLAANEQWEQANLTTLQKRAVEWDARGRRDQDLLNRLVLHDVEEQVARTPDEPLTAVEEEFLLKSRQRMATASARLRVNLDDLGWGVLFAEDDPRRDAIRLALAPLFEHRRKKVGSRFTQFEFIVKAGETAQQFLARYGALARSGSDTERMPVLPHDRRRAGAHSLRVPVRTRRAYAVGRVDFQGGTREETLGDVRTLCAKRRRCRERSVGPASPGRHLQRPQQVRHSEPDAGDGLDPPDARGAAA